MAKKRRRQIVVAQTKSETVVAVAKQPSKRDPKPRFTIKWRGVGSPPKKVLRDA